MLDIAAILLSVENELTKLEAAVERDSKSLKQRIAAVKDAMKV